MTFKSILAAPPTPARCLLCASVSVLLSFSVWAQSYVVESSTNLTTWQAITATNPTTGFRVFRVHGIGQGWTNNFGTLSYGAAVTFSNNLLAVVGPLATTNDSARWAARGTNFTLGAKLQ